MRRRRRQLDPTPVRRATQPPCNPDAIVLYPWTDAEIACRLLVIVEPSDRALAGWDPGYGRLP